MNIPSNHIIGFFSFPLYTEIYFGHLSQTFTDGIADFYFSSGEFEIYTMESSAVMFFGMERFLSYMPPHKVAAMNLIGVCCYWYSC